MADIKTFQKINKEYIDLERSIRFLNNNYVLVGIPDEANGRDDNADVTNADLLFIHTNGSPVNHIPPRPVIEPAIMNDKDRINSMLLKVFDRISKHDRGGAIRQLQLIGMRAQNVCRAWFVDPNNGWPPNSPATYQAKLEKYKRSHKGKQGTYTPRPLIDTGELRKSITYVLSLRGRRSK